MKKIFVPAFIMLISTSVFSQYKKASFFTKDGRVYELGAISSLFPDKDGAPPLSIFYSNSYEGEKKLSFLGELEFMMKSKVTYNASYFDNTTNTNKQGMVYVNRGASLLGKYGVQYRFVNTQNENSKLEPYLKGSIFYGTRLKEYIVTDKNGNEISPSPYPTGTANVFGIEGGAGISYYFTKNLGIRVGGFYRYAISADKISGNATGVYDMFKSHPGFSLSFKYRIFSE